MTSHVMPTADSIADAETLVSFVALQLDAPLQVVDALIDAEGFGGFTRMVAGSVLVGDAGSDFAQLAARAAFRACPGLRVPDFESEEDR